ncbi:DNA-binding response regulator [Terrihabitans soli]|uniref:DNA-binding response regulator n=1 Tax=Terrihabitans soli TaxID=708113 RepID=A0A6S6QWR0_9HYPH|nr:response regulator transcription factor [Terrihabitans soli]BCJ90968.1 DNA-binding response regulator [Terrihabitans soli]
MRLLLVEDSTRLRELLGEVVADAGWHLDAFESATDGAHAAHDIPYDLALIDLGLPDGDGLDLIRTLRAGGKTLPILILTARDGVDARVAGLDAGADDYLVKPFNNRELMARCRALLRRSPALAGNVLDFGGLSFDPQSRTATLSGEALRLTPRESSLLEVLIRNAGHVVTRARIEAALSSFDAELSPNALDLAVSRLRRSLGAQRGLKLETVRGVGYLLRNATDAA